jgi:nucleotide-binding universal stress UspA family protein
MTSHPKIVVGIDGSPRGDDALAFARVLADVLGTGLLLACIYGPGDTRAHARAVLDARRSSVTDLTVEVTAYADTSPARGSLTSPPLAAPRSSWSGRAIGPASAWW